MRRRRTHGLRWALIYLCALALLLTHALEQAHAATSVEADTAHKTRAPSGTADVQNPWNAKQNVQYAHEAAQRNAYGQAVLYLERARYLRPFDLDVRQGLLLVRQQIQRNRMSRFRHVQLTQGEPDGLWWWRAFNVLPTRIWAGAALVLLWAAFVLWLVVRRMRTSVPKDAFATTATLSLLLSIFAGICWFGAARTMEYLEPGVVIDTQPHLFHAPDELSTPEQHPDLYEGAVVLIRNQSAGWTEIELAGRKRIWVKLDTVAPIEPPTRNAQLRRP